MKSTEATDNNTPLAAPGVLHYAKFEMLENLKSKFPELKQLSYI